MTDLDLAAIKERLVTFRAFDGHEFNTGPQTNELKAKRNLIDCHAITDLARLIQEIERLEAERDEWKALAEKDYL